MAYLKNMKVMHSSERALTCQILDAEAVWSSHNCAQPADNVLQIGTRREIYRPLYLSLRCRSLTLTVHRLSAEKNWLHAVTEHLPASASVLTPSFKHEDLPL